MKVSKIVIITFLILLIISLPSFCRGDDSTYTVNELLERIKDYTVEKLPSWPFYLYAEPVTMPTESGPATIRLTISPNFESNKIIINILEIDKLEYSGSTSWFMAIPRGDTITYDLNVVIPPNDTSGMTIEVACGDNIRQYIHPYFVAYADSIRYYFGNPKHYMGISSRRTPKKSIGISDEEFLKQREERRKLQAIAQSDTTKVWVKDENDNWVLEDIDFTKLRRHRMTPKEKMREMEKTPLTSATQEDIVVDGKFYYRNKGEYKFKPLVPSEGPLAPESEKNKIDSLRAAQPDREYHMVFDLTDKADYDHVMTLVDSLIPMEQEGFYHTFILRSKIIFIEKRDIRYNFYPNYPFDNSKPPPGIKKNKTFNIK